MEIIIRTQDTETVQSLTAKPAAEQPATPPAGVLEQAVAVGAINAGPAPTSPDQTGAPPVHIAEREHVHAASGSASSAGAAPRIP
jgi:hypothetical protein